MHNHVLTEDPRIMPLISKSQRRPSFNRFGEVQALYLEELKRQVLQLVSPNQTSTIHASRMQSQSFKGPLVFMQVYDPLDMHYGCHVEMFGAKINSGIIRCHHRNTQGKDNQTMILKCPFKLIYREKESGPVVRKAYTRCWWWRDEKRYILSH